VNELELQMTGNPVTKQGNIYGYCSATTKPFTAESLESKGSNAGSADKP